jgi:hypothetical protein
LNLEDWGLALVLGLYPLAGQTMEPGDALTLLGIATIVAVGTRLPDSSPLYRPILASGVCVLLVLLCLLLPSTRAVSPPVGAGSVLVGPEGPRGLAQLLVAGVLACSLLRARPPRAPAVRGVDPAFVLVAIGAAAAVVWLISHAQVEAARALGGLAVSLGLVFGVHRLHLRRSPHLPLLARAGALAAFGAVLVAFSRRGFA